MISIRNFTVNERGQEGQERTILNDISLTIYEKQKCVFFGEQASGVRELVEYLKGNGRVNEGRVIKKGTVSAFGTEIWNNKNTIGNIRRKDIQTVHCYLDKTISGSVITPNDLIRTISKEYGIFRGKKRRDIYRDKLEKRFTNFSVHNVSLSRPFNKMDPIKAKKVFMAIISFIEKVDMFIIDGVDTIEDILIVRDCLKYTSSTTIVLSNHPSSLALGNKVYIFYGGEILEFGKPIDILYDARHPYTWAVLESLPTPQTRNVKPIEGYLIDYATSIDSDIFSTRSSYALEIDFETKPNYFLVSDQHYAKTWLLDKRAPYIKTSPNIEARKNIYKRLKNETE